MHAKTCIHLYCESGGGGGGGGGAGGGVSAMYVLRFLYSNPIVCSLLSTTKNDCLDLISHALDLEFTYISTICTC